MKKYIIRTLIFFVALFLSDLIFGIVLKTAYDNSKSNEISKLRISIESTSQDVLFFGSSTCESHYIPNIITKYTGLSAYNCGFMAQGLSFSYIQIHETLKRYSPKLIMVDVSPYITYDLYSNEKVRTLLPFNSKDTVIKNILTNGLLIERIKLLSKVYPYNGFFFNPISIFRGESVDSEKGYVPINGAVDTVSLKSVVYPPLAQRNESFKKRIVYLQRIISECKAKKVQLVVVTSPIFKLGDIEREIINKIRIEAEQESIIFFDFSEDKQFYNKIDLFKDRLHLNNIGAHIYSQKISKLIGDLEH